MIDAEMSITKGRRGKSMFKPPQSSAVGLCTLCGFIHAVTKVNQGWRFGPTPMCLFCLQAHILETHRKKSVDEGNNGHGLDMESNSNIRRNIIV